MGETRSALGVICSSYDGFFEAEKKIADYMMEHKAEVVDMTVGELARHIYDAAKVSPLEEVYYCPDKDSAHSVLDKVIRPHTTGLVKAPRGMAFEDLVEYLKSITKEAE